MNIYFERDRVSHILDVTEIELRSYLSTQPLFSDQLVLAKLI